MALSLTVAIVGSTVSPRVQAASGPGVENADPMQKFEDAEALYQQGDYDGAIRLLRELIRGHDDPVLYYNLGRAYEGAGEPEAAVDAYERYLQRSPDAPDREAIEQRIAGLHEELQGASSDVDPTDEEVVAPAPVVEPADPVTEPVRRPSGPSAYLPWTLLGLGAAGLVTGGVFGILATRNEAKAEDASRQVDARDALDVARQQALGANVSFAIGGALALAGLTWGIVSTVRARRPPARAKSEARSRVRLHGLGLVTRF